jgi:hypothetical protein
MACWVAASDLQPGCIWAALALLLVAGEGLALLLVAGEGLAAAGGWRERRAGWKGAAGGWRGAAGAAVWRKDWGWLEKGCWWLERGCWGYAGGWRRTRAGKGCWWLEKDGLAGKGLLCGRTGLAGRGC